MCQDALDDILHEFVAAMTLAEDCADPMEAIRVMARAEKILGIFVEAGFGNCAEYRQELRNDLDTIRRMARRQFIKRALLAPNHEVEAYLADMHNPKLHFDGADASEEFEAACQHLDCGRPLNDGLLKRQRN